MFCFSFFFFLEVANILPKSLQDFSLSSAPTPLTLLVTMFSHCLSCPSVWLQEEHHQNHSGQLKKKNTASWATSQSCGIQREKRKFICNKPQDDSDTGTSGLRGEETFNLTWAGSLLHLPLSTALGQFSQISETVPRKPGDCILPKHRRVGLECDVVSIWQDQNQRKTEALGWKGG